MSADRPEGAEATGVVPALVRDYRRLLRLFPFAYRRAHGAEMLGHLLDAAAPGQSRPARGDVVDLLRAAAREWALAPLGSLPAQRRAATVWTLALLVPLLGVGSVAGLAGVVTGGLARGFDGMLASGPLAASWAVWAVGVLVVVAGAPRAASWVITSGTVLAWAAIVVLVARGELLAVYTAVGWAVGQTACAVVVREYGRWAHSFRWSAWARVALFVGAAAVAVPVVAVLHGLTGGINWLFAGPVPFGVVFDTQTLLVPAGVAGVLLTARPRARQSVPVMAGVVTAIGVGRAGIFGSRTAPFYGIDLGEVAVLLLAALVVTVASRWVVNRLDELAEARRSLAEPLLPSAGNPMVT